MKSIAIAVLVLVCGASIARGADIETTELKNELGLNIGMRVVTKTTEKTRGMARGIVETWGQPDERSEDGLRASWIKDGWEMEMVAEPDGSAVFTMMAKQVPESRESPVDNYEEEQAAKIAGEDVEDPLDRQNRAVDEEMRAYIDRTRSQWTRPRGGFCGAGRIWVDSYTKRDGTRVSGYCRSLPRP